MRLEEPRFEIREPKSVLNWYAGEVEHRGRISTRSVRSPKEDTPFPFIGRIKDVGHLTVLERAHMTVDFTLSRKAADQLVRHRLMSPLMESTRYCDYSKEKHGGELVFIEDGWLKRCSAEERADRISLLEHCERVYLKWPCRAQEKAYDLVLRLRTKLQVHANLTSWIHILKTRSDKSVDVELRNTIQELIVEAKAHHELYRIAFDGI